MLIDETTCIRLACVETSELPCSVNDVSTIQLSTKKLDRNTRINPDIVATLIASLRTKVVELEAQWRELSVSDGGRISNAISEHRSIVSSSSEIQRSANDVAAAMQRLGGDFSERIGSLLELDVAYSRMVDTRALFDSFLHILLDLHYMYTSLKNGELYHAAKLYRITGDAHMSSLVGDGVPQLEAEEQAKVRTTDTGSNREHSVLYHTSNTVSRFLQAKMASIERLLDQKVSSMLTDWLTLSNSSMAQLGLDAMHICELEIAYSNLERKEKQQSLDGMVKRDGSMDPAVTCLSRAAHMRQTTSQIRRLAEDHLNSLSQNIEILLKAVSIERTYSNSYRLLEQYTCGREGQLGALLVPPTGEGEEGGYLNRLVGFFLVEMNVYNSIPLLGTKEHLQSTWEGSASAIVAEVGAMLDEAPSTCVMLHLKTLALHACQSLEKYQMEIVNTQCFRDILISRMDRFLNLLYEPTMVSLEAAEGDEEMVTVSVTACMNSIHNYLEGIVASNSINNTVVAEAEKIFSKLLFSVLSAIKHEASDDSDAVEKLLVFIESTDMIQGILVKNIAHRDPVNVSQGALDMLVNDAICQCCTILATNSVGEAMKAMPYDSLNIRQKIESDMISSWSDSIIEQFDFYSQEIAEYGFRDQIQEMVLVVLADKIAERVFSYFETYSGSVTEFGIQALAVDLDALRNAFPSHASDAENNNVLDNMLSVCTALACGDLDRLQQSINDERMKHVVTFAIIMLEKLANSGKGSLSLDRETARKLASKFRVQLGI